MRFFTTIIATLMLSSNASAGQIWLTMDQVRPYETEIPAGKIVVGNPGIADVLQIDDKKKIMLVGKAPGLTNIFIFDEDGIVIENLKIRVKSSDNEMLTFHRGSARTTYNCTNQCEATVTIGDENSTFQGLTQQTQAKLQQASGENNN